MSHNLFPSTTNRISLIKKSLFREAASTLVMLLDFRARIFDFKPLILWNKGEEEKKGRRECKS